MSLAVEYGSPREAANAPCVICGIPNREHTRTAAWMCVREILRHPEADAADICVLLAGALTAIAEIPALPGTNHATFLQRQLQMLADELLNAFAYRRNLQ